MQIEQPRLRGRFLPIYTDGLSRAARYYRRNRDKHPLGPRRVAKTAEERARVRREYYQANRETILASRAKRYRRDAALRARLLERARMYRLADRWLVAWMADRGSKWE